MSRAVKEGKSVLRNEISDECWILYYLSICYFIKFVKNEYWDGCASIVAIHPFELILQQHFGVILLIYFFIMACLNMKKQQQK